MPRVNIIREWTCFLFSNIFIGIHVQIPSQKEWLGELLAQFSSPSSRSKLSPSWDVVSAVRHRHVVAAVPWDVQRVEQIMRWCPLGWEDLVIRWYLGGCSFGNPRKILVHQIEGVTLISLQFYRDVWGWTFQILADRSFFGVFFSCTSKSGNPVEISTTGAGRAAKADTRGIGIAQHSHLTATRIFLCWKVSGLLLVVVSCFCWPLVSFFWLKIPCTWFVTTFFP